MSNQVGPVVPTVSDSALLPKPGAETHRCRRKITVRKHKQLQEAAKHAEERAGSAVGDVTNGRLEQVATAKQKKANRLRKRAAAMIPDQPEIVH